ncbi:MAG: single-stranded DNA-binding protein [Leptolyngbya sp. SIO4C1]|nr:single-stranded DNA-binding protein [Leptolyngbya sp. SIO4C1]
MNHCILMAEVVQAPQLRYTSDNQTPVTEFVVQIPGLRSEDASVQLKAVGWGNLAQEIQERYQLGDRVVIEGRLTMKTVDRPEGFREKRAEITVQRLHSLSDLQTAAFAEAAVTASASGPPAPTATAATAQSPAATATAEPDYDDIPF